MFIKFEGFEMFIKFEGFEMLLVQHFKPFKHFKQ